MLCGRGNNGGDGFVVARTLLQRGIDVVGLPASAALADVRGDARINLEILGRLGVTRGRDRRRADAGSCTSPRSPQCTLIVDAMFGTGLKAPLSGLLETVVADVNASDIPIVADRPAERAVGRHAAPDRRLRSKRR